MENQLQEQTATEMPKYICHKQVWALKIKSIKTENDKESEFLGGGAILSFTDLVYGDRYVSKDFMTRHKPEAGGYFVVYADGYESWSPAKAFEEGYKRI